MVTGGTCRIKF